MSMNDKAINANKWKDFFVVEKFYRKIGKQLNVFEIKMTKNNEFGPKSSGTFQGTVASFIFIFIQIIQFGKTKKKQLKASNLIQIQKFSDKFIYFRSCISTSFLQVTNIASTKQT